jgi:hypothetical protein
MNTVVTEAGITLDTRFFSQNIIVLTLEVANDLLEGRLIINVVSESGRIYDGEGDPNTILVQFNVDWFDSDSIFNVSGLWIVGYFVRQNLGLAKGVHEGCSPSSRSTNDHNGELDTFLDVLSPSTSSSHVCG